MALRLSATRGTQHKPPADGGFVASGLTWPTADQRARLKRLERTGLERASNRTERSYIEHVFAVKLPRTFRIAGRVVQVRETTVPDDLIPARAGAGTYAPYRHFQVRIGGSAAQTLYAMVQPDGRLTHQDAPEGSSRFGFSKTYATVPAMVADVLRARGA